MKKRLLIIVLILLTLIPLTSYCQEEITENNDIHFIEIGTGAGYTRQVHGAFNVGLTNSIGRFVANFIDYNRVFGKSEVLFHEINFKIGPYYKFNRYSYIAASSGLSYMWNTPFVEYDYDNQFHQPFPNYSESESLISIPIQVKLNIGVYKAGCIGLKGTYNKMLDEWVADKWTVLMYLAIGF